MSTAEAVKKAEAPVTQPPDFWPTGMMDEFKVAMAIKATLNLRFSDGDKVDIYSGDSVAMYLAELQTISASSAELMGRMRKALEEARGAAIVAAMTDEALNFSKLSATLQSRYVDSKIAMMLAAYEYAEYLSKRVSYAMDAGRSILSYIKEDMYRNRPIPQQ